VASNLAPVGKPPSLDGKIETPPKVPADETYGIDVNIRNVVSHTLGIALGPERKSHPMIKKNFDIPFQTSESHFTTVVDNQPKVMIEVYEGEGEFVDAPDMTKVGEFELSGWEPGPAGHVQFKIDFSIDMNGILTVSATEIKSNIKVEETFKRDDAVKTLEDMQQEVNEISQEGVKQSREASAGTPAQPSRMEPPPGLPEEYAGYWAEAAAKIPSLEPTLAEGLKAKMAELAKAVQSGDADSIEKTGQELTEQMYELM
jgi:molecular chaperone DnaK (HSP70)